MKKRNRKGASAGFSLVEVVAAITVLGLVVAGVSTSLVTSIQFNARTEQRLQAELAVANANSIMEMLRTEGYDGTTTQYGNMTVTVLKRDPDIDPEAQPGAAEAKCFGYLVTLADKTDPELCCTFYAPVKEGGDS
ncbi:MAG: type II secretion system protein [Oscillospiraceae bacterium]|nr:type II secretion system protein [Oscillospiraceae bacterium]